MDRRREAKIENLFKEFDGDIEKISQELRRGERSVRMNILYGFNQSGRSRPKILNKKNKIVLTVLSL